MIISSLEQSVSYRLCFASGSLLKIHVCCYPYLYQKSSFPRLFSFEVGTDSVRNSQRKKLFENCHVFIALGHV